MCKFILGVPSSASNLDCYSELGRIPLVIKRKTLIIQYWLRIVTDWSIPVLLKAAYALNKNLNAIWIKNVKEILNTSGFSFVWDHPEVVDPSRFLDELERSDWLSNSSSHGTVSVE